MTNLPAEYRRRAVALLASGIETYGLPTSGPIYDGNLRALIDPTMYDFRLAELPQLVGDQAYLQQRRTILDLGCGPGTLVFRALEYGHDAWGIDLDADRIELARFRVTAFGHSEEWKSHVLCADATDLPFVDETFDVLSSHQVLEHIECLSQALYEAVRVTKRGGWLHLHAPDYRQSFDNHYTMTWPRFMPRAQGIRWAQAMGRPSTGVGTFFYVTMPQVVAILEALGCRIASATLWQYFPEARRRFEGTLPSDQIIFRSDVSVEGVARQIQKMEAAGTLPDVYCRPLEFTILAERI